MQNRSGGQQVYFSGLWWGIDFPHFWAIFTSRPFKPILLCKLEPGKRPYWEIFKLKYHRFSWQQKWESENIGYLDPTVQMVYPKGSKIEEYSTYYA